MKISKKLTTAIAVALMGMNFGVGSFSPAEASSTYYIDEDGLYHVISQPTTTGTTSSTKTTPSTNSTASTKTTSTVADNKVTTQSTNKTDSVAKLQNDGKTTTAKTDTTAKKATTATTADQGVLTKVAVKEPGTISAVTINARDKGYLVNAGKFPIGKIGTTKTFANKVSSGSITYYKDAIRITEIVSKNAPPKALTYINMGKVGLTQANIKGVSSGKEISKRLNDSYNQKEKDYKLTQHGVLHVFSNDKNRATIVLEIPNDTYVQEKIKANDKLRTDLKNLDKKRNTAITTAATALSQTTKLRADVDKLMTNSYYTEWRKTDALRIEKEGIEAEQKYLNTQMTSATNNLKSLQTKKAAADKKVKDLQTQKSKAKTTADKNKIQKQITSAQATQKSLASQITTATNKKASLQKQVTTVNNRHKTVVAQWQSSWNKVNTVNTKVDSLKKSYNTARDQYNTAKKTIESSAEQIKKLNSNAVIKSWKTTSIPASTSF